MGVRDSELCSVVVLAGCLVGQIVVALRIPTYVGVGFVVTCLVVDLLVLAAFALLRTRRDIS